MTYLTKNFCQKILKKSIASAIKLLCELDELKETPGNESRIAFIQKKLVCINNIIEAVNQYNDN
jgi:hypothetical protein